MKFAANHWAADLWFSVSENIQIVRDAGTDESVFPIRADARTLPFSENFFDAIVSIDAFPFFGTDDLYLTYLARFLKEEGSIGIAQAGFTNELAEPIPAHMVEWWAAEMPYCLHTTE